MIRSGYTTWTAALPRRCLLARPESDALEVLFGNTSRDADVMVFVELDHAAS